MGGFYLARLPPQNAGGVGGIEVPAGRDSLS
jgi:hypothetical protein